MNNLLQYLYWWFDFQLPPFVPRRYPREILDTKAIPVLVGPRRSGKSTLLFQIIAELQRSQPRQNLLYLNLEDDRLAPLTGNELTGLLDTYRQHFAANPATPVYLFLDEIQNLPGWERTLRRLYDTEPTLRIMLTGSNAKMLSSDISTALRGRTLTVEILPLNFVEFLQFKNVPLPKKTALRYSSEKRNILLNAFQEYLSFGGFPAVVLENSLAMKTRILQEYFRTIFFADLIERYEIRSVKLLEAFLKILARQMSSLFSIGKMMASLKSVGFKVSKNTLINYFGYIEASFLGRGVSIYSYSIKDQLQYPKKFYLLDNGLYRVASFVKQEDSGRLLENLVFNHLRQQHDEIFYWKGPNGYEVDFVLPRLFEQKALPALVQVCFNLKDARTRQREFRALSRAAKEFGVSHALILTRDTRGEDRIGHLRINLQPFIDWAVDLPHVTWRTRR